jgi:hypothetical protein
MRLGIFEYDEVNYEDLVRFGLRLLCLQHGMRTVMRQLPIGRIKGEGGGSEPRQDFHYSLSCGCIRRKDIDAKSLLDTV